MYKPLFILVNLTIYPGRYATQVQLDQTVLFDFSTHGQIQRGDRGSRPASMKINKWLKAAQSVTFDLTLEIIFLFFKNTVKIPSKTLYALLSIGSTQEDSSRYDWKIVDLDVKNQNEQNWYAIRADTDHTASERVAWSGSNAACKHMEEMQIMKCGCRPKFRPLAPHAYLKNYFMHMQ